MSIVGSHDDFVSTDSDRLLLIASFVVVAEKLSFSEAAIEAGTNVSTLSRRVSRLEQSLGVRLFNRTTRRVSLTEPGQIYFSMCMKILEDVAKAGAIAGSYNSNPRGILRITVPVAFGRLYMVDVFRGFLERYSEVHLDLNFSDRFVDLITERYDLAIRTGRMSDSSLVIRKLVTNHRAVVASPAYLEKHGVPTAPADLQHHNCIRNASYTDRNWDFQRGDVREHIQVTGNMSIDNSEAVCEAAASGCGIGLVAQYICGDLVRRGKLVVLLPDWEVMHSVGIYAVYPNTDLLAPKVRVFIDYLIERMRETNWNEKEARSA